MEDSNANSDDIELVRARDALRCASFHELRDLEVERAGASLVISGRVKTFYHKQMAQEAIRAVCNEIELKNAVDVDE